LRGGLRRGAVTMRTTHNLQNKIYFRKKLRRNSTPQEIILWSRLRRNQLGFKFRRQHSIGKYIVDFYCPEKKLIIEVDGGQHDEDAIKKYDKRRSEYLEKLNFRILRFWDRDINLNLEGVIGEINIFLQESLK
jgi:very-short-patch-repair endonuclease